MMNSFRPGRRHRRKSRRLTQSPLAVEWLESRSLLAAIPSPVSDFAKSERFALGDEGVPYSTPTMTLVTITWETDYASSSRYASGPMNSAVWLFTTRPMPVPKPPQQGEGESPVPTSPPTTPTPPAPPGHVPNTSPPASGPSGSNPPPIIPSTTPTPDFNSGNSVLNSAAVPAVPGNPSAPAESVRAASSVWNAWLDATSHDDALEDQEDSALDDSRDKLAAGDNLELHGSDDRSSNDLPAEELESQDQFVKQRQVRRAATPDAQMHRREALASAAMTTDAIDAVLAELARDRTVDESWFTAECDESADTAAYDDSDLVEIALDRQAVDERQFASEYAN